MERNYYTARNTKIFIIILFAILFIVNYFLIDDIDVVFIPHATYLMMVVTLCFIDVIVFIFMLLYYIVNRQFSKLILSLAFFSGIIYYIETIISVNGFVQSALSVQSTTNDIAIFYLFRQLSLITLLTIALVTTKLNTETKNGNKIKLIVLMFCLVPLVFFPVVAHSLSSFDSAYSYIMASYVEQPDKKFDAILLNVRYVNMLVGIWFFLFLAIIILNKLSSDVWGGIVVISLSAIIYNLFFQFLDDNLSIWYVSRAIEIFSKLFIASILVYHILKLMITPRDISVRDPLTSVYNRNHFLYELGLISENKIHPGFCLMVLDIDNIKGINSKWGYQVGDQVILAVVDIIKKNIRQDDLLARLAGQEFGVILYAASVERSAQLAERIRASVELHTQTGNIYNIPEPITVSIGAFFNSDKNRDASNINEMACRALYEAKRSGRNKVVLHHSLAIQASVAGG